MNKLYFDCNSEMTKRDGRQARPSHYRITLKEVVEKVIRESSFKEQDPTNIFKNIGVVAEGEDKPWFEQHADMSQCFDKNRMGEIWIRNLSNYRGGEEEKCPNGSFYMEDGNHQR